MRSSHHNTPSTQWQSSENSLISTQQRVSRKPPLLTKSADQKSSHPYQVNRKGTVTFLFAQVLALLPIAISLTILGLAAIHTGSCVEAQAGEGNRIRVGCWK